MKVKYVGPHDEVEVPSLDVVCARGHAVEIPAGTEVNVVKAMLASEVWEAADKDSKALVAAPAGAESPEEGEVG